MLRVFDDMTTDMLSNKKTPVVIELFSREGKLNISIVFISIVLNPHIILS